MNQYSKEAVRAFLEQQTLIYDEKVADTVHEAKEFLEENMAVELDSLKDVKEFMNENGMDIAGMTDEEIKEQSEVLELPSGRFLVIAGY